MQQPANMDGRPVIALAQTVPLDTQSRYRNMKSGLAQKLIRCGIMHVVIGVLCIALPITELTVSIGESIWTGIVILLFTVTGAFGIAAGKKKERWQVITFNVLSILSAIFAAVLLSLGIIYAPFFNFSDSFQVKHKVVWSYEALLAGSAEVTVAIFSSTACCTIGACCCDCGGSCCCPIDPEYHQPTFNPNQQPLMYSPNRQQPTFNPNQQQLTFTPNQQQPKFKPNQQQPAFYPIQQQPAFNPNQRVTGRCPQQYAVRYFAHQQNVSLNHPQPDFSAFSPETTGLTTASVTTETNAQPDGDGSYEGLNRFSNSEMFSPHEAPPTYDDVCSGGDATADCSYATADCSYATADCSYD